jgi:hypothetical protein
LTRQFVKLELEAGSTKAEQQDELALEEIESSEGEVVNVNQISQEGDEMGHADQKEAIKTFEY